MKISAHPAPVNLAWSGIRRADRVFLLALGVLVIVLSLRDFDSFQFGFSPDSLQYTLLSRALVSAARFAVYTSAAFPVSTHYPFGYPMLLLPFVIGLPNVFDAPQLLSLAATLANGALIFIGWRTYAPELGERWRYAATAMTVLAPLTLSFTRYVLSEPIFTTALLLALFFGARLKRAPQNRRQWFVFGVAAFFLVQIRSIGWVCLAAILAYLLYTQHRRILPALVASIAVMVGLTAPVLALTPVALPDLIPSTYVRWYLNLPPPADSEYPPTPAGAEVTLENAPQVLLTFLGVRIHTDLRRVLLLTGGGDTEPRIAAQLGMPWLINLPGWSAIVLVVLGGVRWARLTPGRRRHSLSLFEFTALVYLVVILLWRDRDDRLLYPVLPALYLSLMLGVWVVLESAGRGLARFTTRPAQQALFRQRLPLALVTLVIVGWLVLASWRDLHLQTSYETWGDLRRRTAVIDRIVPRDATLGSDWSTLDSLYLRREVVDISFGGKTADGMLSRWTAQKVQYVALAMNANLDKLGITPEYEPLGRNLDLVRELVARGVLVPVYADPYPIQIFRLEP